MSACLLRDIILSILKLARRSLGKESPGRLPNARRKRHLSRKRPQQCAVSLLVYLPRKLLVPDCEGEGGLGGGAWTDYTIMSWGWGKRARTHTHTYTHARTCARAHTHTQIQGEVDDREQSVWVNQRQTDKQPDTQLDSTNPCRTRVQLRMFSSVPVLITSPYTDHRPDSQQAASGDTDHRPDSQQAAY